MANAVKEKKSHRRINAFDVMIILLALCLVATLGYRIYKGVSTPDLSENSKYIVEFECDEIYNSLVNYIKNDDAVYFLKNGDVFGHIYMGKGDEAPLMIDGADAPEETESGEEGELEEEVSYEKVKARGKILLNADAIANGNYFTVGEMGFTVGSEIEVNTSVAVFTITVTGIHSIE